MGYPLNFAKSKKTKIDIKPGEYHSEIISVKDADGYRLGDAFTIHYALVEVTSAVSHSKTETFLNDPSNSRTASFLNYLASNGVTVNSTDDLIGISEKLTLTYEVIDGKRYLNISHREFVSEGLLA